MPYSVIIKPTPKFTLNQVPIICSPPPPSLPLFMFSSSLCLKENSYLSSHSASIILVSLPMCLSCQYYKLWGKYRFTTLFSTLSSIYSLSFPLLEKCSLSFCLSYFMGMYWMGGNGWLYYSFSEDWLMSCLKNFMKKRSPSKKQNQL